MPAWGSKIYIKKGKEAANKPVINEDSEPINEMNEIEEPMKETVRAPVKQK